MSYFIYNAVDKGGKTSKGAAVALDQAEVLRDIKARDLFPVEVKQVSEQEFYRLKPSLQKRRSFEWMTARRLSTKELVFLLRDLSSLVGAGVIITRALDILAEQNHSASTKNVLGSVQEIVSQGQPFSESLRKFPQYFPPLVSEMISVGEHSGRLEDIVNRLAIFYERQEEIESRFKQAMIYPILIFSVAIMAVILFLTVALPRIIKLYDDLGTELPGITMGLIHASEFMQVGWPFLLILFFLGGFFLRFCMRYPSYRSYMHALYLKLPIVGPLQCKIIQSRLLRAISAMYKSGIPVLVIFQMLPQVIQNVIFEQAIQRIEGRVRRGEGLANAFLQEKIFPRSVANIMFVGEESGTLDTNLDRIASRFEEEVDRTTKMLGTLLEPIFIVVMGGFVLFIALALFMPLIKLVSTLSTEG